LILKAGSLMASDTLLLKHGRLNHYQFQIIMKLIRIWLRLNLEEGMRIWINILVCMIKMVNRHFNNKR